MDGIKVELLSEDVGGRVKKIRFVISSPGKESYVEAFRPQSEGEILTCHRKSEEFNGVFNFHVTNWVGYRATDNTASGLKVKCSFTKMMSFKSVKIPENK